MPHEALPVSRSGRSSKQGGEASARHRAALTLRTTLVLLVAITGIAGPIVGCARKAAAPALTQQEISEFHDAVNDGDAVIIDRLLAAKPALVNAPNAAGRRPLAVARERGNDEAADVLRRHGALE